MASRELLISGPEPSDQSKVGWGETDWKNLHYEGANKNCQNKLHKRTVLRFAFIEVHNIVQYLKMW